MQKVTDQQIEAVETHLSKQFLRLFVKNTRTHIKEHECILWVRDVLDYPWADEALLALFQQHFIVRHCVYRLQKVFAVEHRINITTNVVGFDLSPSIPVEQKLPDTDISYTELRSYYSDLSNLYSANSDTVADTLASFWKRYNALEDSTSALAELGLSCDAGWHEIQQKYRELAQRHHPDRGGDSKKFVSIREAYLCLKDIKR